MLVLTSDHAGFNLKENIKKFLTKEGINFVDNGPLNSELTDYPDFAESASKMVLESSKNIGIFICGTGVGMGIAANKIKGIRAAVVCCHKVAEKAVEHNNANVITIGSRHTSLKKAKKIIKAVINANFEKGRHLRRVNKINSIENKNSD